MKKLFQIAFAIVFMLISLASFFFESEQINNIILASVIPSFLLSVISFFDEIISKCEENTEIIINDLHKKKDESMAERKKIPRNITNRDTELWLKRRKLDYELSDIDRDANFYLITNSICEKMRTVSNWLIVISYVALILSLVFAPLFIVIFSHVNLNCITLWSLTILYINIELKQELCDYVFNRIKRTAERINNRMM